jgi:hypothetical protein
MWINDKVTYTPEVITTTKGKPVSATVKSVGIDGTLLLTLDDGSQQRVPANSCIPAP